MRFFGNMVLFLILAVAKPAEVIAQVDQDAKQILDNISQTYTSYESIAIDFSLDIELPERKAETESGRIIQVNKSFKLEMADQDIYCNGKSLWYHLKEKNEVQINDYDEDDEVGVLSPMDVLKQYERGEFEYRLLSHNDKIAQIEFKPNDRYSDYSKLKIHINTADSKIVTVKAFAKDGSIFSFVIEEETVNRSYKPSEFLFDSTLHPSVEVEDLRID